MLPTSSFSNVGPGSTSRGFRSTISKFSSESLFDRFDDDTSRTRYMCLLRWGAILSFVTVQILSLFAIFFLSFTKNWHIFVYFLVQSLINALVCFVAVMSYIRTTQGDGGQYKIPPFLLGGALLLVQAYGGFSLLRAHVPVEDAEKGSTSFILFLTVISILTYSIASTIHIIEAIRHSGARVDRKMYSLAATQDFELDDNGMDGDDVYFSGGEVEYDLEIGLGDENASHKKVKTGKQSSNPSTLDHKMDIKPASENSSRA